jgi:hypothetical protein
MRLAPLDRTVTAILTLGDAIALLHRSPILKPRQRRGLRIRRPLARHTPVPRARRPGAHAASGKSTPPTNAEVRADSGGPGQAAPQSQAHVLSRAR